MYCFILLSSNFLKHHDRACVSRSARTFLAPTCVGLSVANIIACNTSLVNILLSSYMFFVQSALVSKANLYNSKVKLRFLATFVTLLTFLTFYRCHISSYSCAFCPFKLTFFTFLASLSSAGFHRPPPLSPLFRPDPAPLAHPNLFLGRNKFIFRKRHL